MNSRVIAAIAAAVLAIVGISAVVVYAAKAKSDAFEGAEMVQVYRVAKDVGANEDAAKVSDSVELVSLPAAAIAKGAVTDLADIEGLKTTVPLVEGEQLLDSRFAKEGAKAAAKGNVPKGLQEIALTLDAAAGVGELIEEGAKVGMIATVEKGEDKRSRMFAQNVPVTNVKSHEDGSMVVTLAVTTAQATQVAAAAQFGQVRLTVQNDETNRDGASAVDVGNVVK
ncbi:RcpC/CpaB family pilus assembly protein [Aeromicrobium duanguangcaii]|uniref:RcpC/CpaB family pilus assembly protein n=1 Tax=Aeromicrobium duanguangcaii TaxID=2968086 RepID=A0ABY5KFZ4_9ACTN|nr:RcpC/CpaB family pilus assembly protein [Aeromicrobium duanguangcaii]MCD9154660.1 RcpC/CpaB family pilus assembly protein [Aeromicrobium duanguangcaii]UUI67926.1 RcpC/CpaB family pilus assembly protein [Aeromicrobium duanguangcaii]